MGYTHYFTKGDNIQQEVIEGIKKDFKSTILELRRAKISIVMEKDVPEISFNGIEEQDHEQFILNTKSGFAFCKTNNKPYDLAVMVCLVIAKKWLNERIKIRSNGKYEDWEPAIDICQKVLGYGKDFRLED